MVGVLVGLLLPALAFSFVVLPEWIVPSSEFEDPFGDDASARVQRQNEIRTVAAQAIAGLVLAIGAVYSARAYSLSREGHLTDRLTAAVEQVHTGGVAAIGGILALDRVAVDSSRDRPTILELLATYVRMNAPIPPAAPPLQPGVRPVMDSVLQAALTTIGRRHSASSGRVLDLSASFLRGADLRDAVLTTAYIERSDLSAARLAGTSARHAHLLGATLNDVDATGIDLRGALLTDASLRKAILTKADLRDTNLKGADLTGAFLSRANLTRSDLSGATGDDATLLYQARLDDARLIGAVMPRAVFLEARLRRADLRGANVSGALFQNADLREARFSATSDLRGADFRSAICRGALFSGADLRGALFDGADLSGADLASIRRDPTDQPLIA